MFPVSGAPVSGLFGATPSNNYSETLVEALALHGRIFEKAAAVLTDGIGLGEVIDAQIINVLNERLALTGTVLPSMDFQAVLTDGMRYHEALALGWKLSLQEEVAMASSAAGQRWVLAAIADVLHATGAVNVSYDARTVLATVLALDALITTGWKLTAIETVEFQDALQGQLTAVARLVDTAVLSDMVSPSMRLTAICSDSIDLGDTLFPRSDLFERLREEILFYVVIRLGDAEYIGWTLNKGQASTEYRNYPMNGLLEFDGAYYGTSSSGLYDLSGPDDDGEDIEYSIKTGVTDFLTGKFKHVPECYIAFSGDGGEVLLKVFVEEESESGEIEIHEHIYTQNLRPGAAMHNDMIEIGRGLEARYWQFELTGKGKIELDELAWRVLILDRRLY